MEKTVFRYLRQRRHLTQKEVAQFMGVSHVAVGKWESGKSMPRAKQLPKLASFLDCSINDFFCSRRNLKLLKEDTKP